MRKVNFLLRQKVRERVRPEANRSAGVTDSQSAKTRESGIPDPALPLSPECWRHAPVLPPDIPYE
jgi:hypothetical protein